LYSDTRQVHVERYPFVGLPVKENLNRPILVSLAALPFFRARKNNSVIGFSPNYSKVKNALKSNPF
jgi:hypothetical protein